MVPARCSKANEPNFWLADRWLTLNVTSCATATYVNSPAPLTPLRKSVFAKRTQTPERWIRAFSRFRVPRRGWNGIPIYRRVAMRAASLRARLGTGRLHPRSADSGRSMPGTSPRRRHPIVRGVARAEDGIGIAVEQGFAVRAFDGHHAASGTELLSAMPPGQDWPHGAGK